MSLILQHHQPMAAVQIVSRRQQRQIIMPEARAEAILWLVSLWWLVQLALMYRQSVIIASEAHAQIGQMIVNLAVALVVADIAQRWTRYAVAYS